jgi:hypothetical protein
LPIDSHFDFARRAIPHNFDDSQSTKLVRALHQVASSASPASFDVQDIEFGRRRRAHIEIEAGFVVSLAIGAEGKPTAEVPGIAVRCGNDKECHIAHLFGFQLRNQMVIHAVETNHPADETRVLVVVDRKQPGLTIRLRLADMPIVS